MMARFIQFGLLVAVAGMAFWFGNQNVPLVQENTDSESTQEMKPLTPFEELENRVAHLERLIFASAQLSTFEAQRRLERAHQRLAQTKQLYFRGTVRQLQLKQDEFLVRRAERELELAKATDGQFQIATEIDMMQAEFGLETALARLESSKRRLQKGFISKAQFANDESLVEEARKQVELVKQKLDTIKEASMDVYQR